MRLSRYVLLTGLAVTTPSHSPVFANPGDLDTSFDTDGHAIIPMDGESYASAIALQPDGKVLAAGYGFNGTDTDIALVRYTSTGSLDTSFDSDGIVLTQIDSDNEYATALAVQPDGKILVAGVVSNGTTANFALLRYTTDGGLDTAFGRGGYTLTQIGPSHAFARALALQPDGKVLVAGATVDGTNTGLALVRYTSTGDLDTTFGGGVVTTPIGVGNTSATTIAVQRDGKVLIAGSSYNTVSNEDFTITRYNANGSLDTAFGSGGIVISPLSQDYDYANALLLQPDDKILVAGTARNGSIETFALARYNSDGTPDPAFGSNGRVLTPVGTGHANARTLVLQPDGKTLVAGLSTGTHSHQYDDDFALVRYTASGSLDTGVSGSGVVLVPYGLDREYTLALQPDGAVLAAGLMSAVASAEFSVSRFLVKDDNNDGVAESWDLTPDAFTFTDATGVAEGSIQTSNLITVNGLDPDVMVPLQIQGGEYAMNGSMSYTTIPAWVQNGDQINVRHTAANGSGVSRETTLTIGGLRVSNNQALILGPTISDTFSSTTSLSVPSDSSGSGDSDGGGGGGGVFGLLSLLSFCLIKLIRLHRNTV